MNSLKSISGKLIFLTLIYFFFVHPVVKYGWSGLFIPAGIIFGGLIVIGMFAFILTRF